MKKLTISLIVLLIAGLSSSTFSQSSSFKITPFGIEPTEKQPLFIYNEIGEILTPDEWEPIGPNGITSNAIAVDPQDANIIYAGGLSGLYKTIDGGSNWEIISGLIPNYRVSAITINFNNPNILLSWLQNNFDVISMKLMRSTNAGITWTEVLTGSGFGGSIIFDPDNTQRAFANASGDSLYLSTDGGINWVALSSIESVRAFNMFLEDPNIMYAVSNSVELYNTTNAGQSWNLQNSQLPATFETLQISITNPDIIFAGDGSFEEDGGFYRSTDGGVNWSHLINGFGRSKSIRNIIVDPGNANIIYAGGYATGLYRSDNMGDQWTNISASIQDNYISAITITTNSNIYSAFGSSIYYSTDLGSSWQSLNGNLQNIDVFKIVSHPTNPGIVYASSFGGIYRSVDGGINWQQINNGLLDTDVFALTINPINPDILYAGTFGDLIYKTTDAGDTWIEKSNGLPGLGQAFIWRLTVHPNDPSWIWTGDRLAYHSIDAGENWSEFMIMGDRIAEMVYAPNHPDTMYASNGPSVLYRSTNRGGNWEVRNTTQSLENLVVDPTNSEVLYATSFNIGEITKSTDGGLTWNVVHSTSNVREISINPQHSNYVYAATFGSGVQRSTDSGASWHNYNNELGNLACFSVQPATGQPHKLFVATFGNSIYQVEETVTSIEDHEKPVALDFKLSQNYPNPFNPSTKIKFTIPDVETGHAPSVQLLVYDVLGNEITTLVNEEKTEGTYEVEWNASNVPSGVYFYQLKTGSFVQTKKMLLLK